MTEVRLNGLEASSPLAFMAALGTLRILDERARSASRSRPRLAWVDAGYWTPVIHGPSDLDEIVGAVMEDHASWGSDASFRFGYTRQGERVDRDHPAVIRDLKAPPPVMREFLSDVAQIAATGVMRSARHAAAYGTDVAVDNNGNTKPTALHFTAGNQTFLGAVDDVYDNLKADDVREALAGPWSRSSGLKTLGWDPMGAFTARMYALRASNPASGEKRPCVPGAEWLAYVGLSFFPTVPQGVRTAATTCVQGGWKDARLTWPIWSPPAGARTVEALLRCPIERLSASQRKARGIEFVFQAAILRSDQGGYGAFSPASVV